AIDNGDARAETRVSLGQALSEAGDRTGALQAFDQAIAAAPDLAIAYGAKALALQTAGRFDEAEALFRKAIELDPDNGETYRVFIASHKVTPGDPLIAEMQARFNKPGLSEESRMNLGFALAKAMEDTRDYARVFTYLRPANDLMRKRFPYDIAERRDELAAYRAAFSDTDFTAREVKGTSDFAPIFVTGLPRSGTTLVEQIIASHSRVTGAGEVGRFVEEAAKEMDSGTGAFRPVSALSDAEIAAIGRRTEAWFRDRFPDADRITDKSVQSYVAIGLIRLALPDARVIVVQRDPRDTLLSIYRNIFPEGRHRYAYSLRDLGLYYRLYQEMIAFWREKLPGGFHEIRYEELIANPENEARKLIAAAGLEWEDQCLNFHENKRQVSTLSVYQVRQPIYTSSMKAWRRYEDELGELFEALGDAIDAEE
ncbi:MAG: sulfotransferase, partial [Paracoccaceae bacterium]